MSDLHAGHMQKRYSEYIHVSVCVCQFVNLQLKTIINHKRLIWYISLITSSYIIFSIKWIKTRQSHMSCWTHQGNHTHTHRRRSQCSIPRALITVNLAHYVWIDARLPLVSCSQVSICCSFTCLHCRSGNLTIHCDRTFYLYLK